MHKILISFKSGHYKSLEGSWDGDSVWGHFTRKDGAKIHVNKDQVEYIQTSEIKTLSTDKILEELKKRSEEIKKKIEENKEQVQAVDVKVEEKKT